MSRFLQFILLAVILLALPACVSTGPTLTSSPHPSARSADGFDTPIGPPDAKGYRESRGFRSHGHLGEDWVSDGGSSKGYQNPVYAIGNGVVVLARDIRADWGNVVIVRHAWIEHRKIQFTDSLYGHLDRIVVHEGEQVRRGQQVGTIGTNHGMYPPHLHFEMHKDLSIGVNHAQGTRDLRSYWVPMDFIRSHRRLDGGGQDVPIPPANFLLPTAEHPWSFHHFFSHSHHSSHGSTTTHHYGSGTSHSSSHHYTHHSSSGKSSSNKSSSSSSSSKSSKKLSSSNKSDS